jgi:signal peptidase I
VVGLPGETLYLWRGHVFINRRLIQEPYLDRNTCTHPDRKLALFILGEGQYFVMGDNRANSIDSRTYGPVGIEQIRKTVPLSAPKLTITRHTLPTCGEGTPKTSKIGCQS